MLLDLWIGWGKFGVVVGFLDRLGKVCVVGGFSSCLLCPSHHSGGGSDRTAETLLNCGISFARHSPHQPFSGNCFPIFIFVFSQARIDSFTLLHLTWLKVIMQLKLDDECGGGY